MALRLKVVTPPVIDADRLIAEFNKIKQYCVFSDDLPGWTAAVEYPPRKVVDPA
jgi:hypothetical protein